MHGRGVSTDGEVWANGFHPLWMVVLLPVFAIFRGDPETPVHVALTISAITTSASGALLYLIARRLAIAAPVSLAATALYLLHPTVVFMSANGMETGLNVSIFVLLLYTLVVAWQAPSGRSFALASAAAGLLVLSRTDYLFVAGAVVFSLFLRWRPPSAVVALGAPAPALVLPWFIWNVAVFGSPVQVSAGAVPYVEHHALLGGTASFGQRAHHAYAIARSDALTRIPHFYFAVDATSTRLAVAFIAGLLTLAALSAFRRRQLREPLLLIGVPAAALVVQFAVHAGIRWYVREWYFIPLFPLLALLIALLVDAAARSAKASIVALALVAAVLAGTVAKAATTYRDGWYPVQLDMLAASRWIDGHTAPDARVGSFNSGLVGYFDRRTTVNLDGVMNPDAAAAIRDRRVGDYIRSRRIDVLADFPFYPFIYYRGFLGEVLITRNLATFGDHLTFQGPYTVYDLTARSTAR